MILEDKKTLPKFQTLVMLSTGGGIRTPINGFGDRYSTLELHPYKKSFVAKTLFETFNIMKSRFLSQGFQLPDQHLRYDHLHGLQSEDLR